MSILPKYVQPVYVENAREVFNDSAIDYLYPERRDFNKYIGIRMVEIFGLQYDQEYLDNTYISKINLDRERTLNEEEDLNDDENDAIKVQIIKDGLQAATVIPPPKNTFSYHIHSKGHFFVLKFNVNYSNNSIENFEIFDSLNPNQDNERVTETKRIFERAFRENDLTFNPNDTITPEIQTQVGCNCFFNACINLILPRERIIRKSYPFLTFGTTREIIFIQEAIKHLEERSSYLEDLLSGSGEETKWQSAWSRAETPIPKEMIGCRRIYGIADVINYINGIEVDKEIKIEILYNLLEEIQKKQYRTKGIPGIVVQDIVNIYLEQFFNPLYGDYQVRINNHYIANGSRERLTSPRIATHSPYTSPKAKRPTKMMDYEEPEEPVVRKFPNRFQKQRTSFSEPFAPKNEDGKPETTEETPIVQEEIEDIAKELNELDPTLLHNKVAFEEVRTNVEALNNNKPIERNSEMVFEFADKQSNTLKKAREMQKNPQTFKKIKLELHPLIKMKFLLLAFELKKLKLQRIKEKQTIFEEHKRKLIADIEIEIIEGKNIRKLTAKETVILATAVLEDLSKKMEQKIPTQQQQK